MGGLGRGWMLEEERQEVVGGQHWSPRALVLSNLGVVPAEEQALASGRLSSTPWTW